MPFPNVYSNGRQIAEYSTGATPPANPTVNYTATDMLGSPRVLTDSLGNVVSRRDFLPFGEELYADGTHRTLAGKYSQTGQDGVRQRFTGYQKDTETGLDFAEARMYGNTLGRFTTVDPFLASGKSSNPQTFNRYIYVLNNPLLLTDPSGLQTGTWYERKDGTGDYIYHYKWNPSLGDDYQEITRRNRAGELISDPTNRSHVIRFNPDGPYLTPNQNLVFGAGWQFLVLSDYARQGYDIITSDWYEDTSIEHPADGYARGSEFVGIELFLAADGAGSLAKAAFSSVGKGAMEISVTASRTEVSTALMETPKSILEPGGELIGTAGSKAAIRELPGGTEAAESVMNRLITTGAQPKYQPTYPGRLFETTRGETFGFRTAMSAKSANAVCTIDCNFWDIAIQKIKFK